MPKLLIVKTGTTDPPVVAVHGDYDDWFKRNLQPFAITWTTVSIFEEAPLPDPRDFDGILITGSPSSVWENQPWMKRTLPWLKNLCHTQSTPVLAVCFGHQILAHALGAEVCPNPKGAEIGTIEMQLTPSGQTDPLFAQLPQPFSIQSIHKDIVSALPSLCHPHLLAHTENTAIQAFAVGKMIRAVQFHPELCAQTLSLLVQVRQLDAKVHTTPYGTQILHNWYTHWIAPQNNHT